MIQINIVIPTTNIDTRLLKVIESIRKRVVSYDMKFQITLVLNPIKSVGAEIERALEDMEICFITSKKGLGNALRESYKYNRAETYVFVPDDLPFGFQEINLALKFNPRTDDLLVLSKYKKITHLNGRLVVGRLFRLLSGALFQIPVTDTQCSFIASKRSIETFSKECFEKGFLITLENILVAQKHNFKISEVEATWQDSSFHRRTTLKYIDPIIMIYQLIRMKIRFGFQD